MSSIESSRVSFDPSPAATLGERMRRAVDPVRMRDVLTACMPYAASWGDVQDVAVAYVAAVPGKELRAWYRIRTAPRDGSVRTRDLSGLIEDPGESQEVGAEGDPAVEPSRRSVPTCRVPQLGMELWEFPADPYLSGLPRLVSAGGVRALLAGVSFVPDAGVEANLVRYVPGKRAMLRFDLRLPQGEHEQRALYCKVYRTRKAVRRAGDRYQAVWEACGADSHAMPTPRPLHLDVGTASLWFESLPGKPLDPAAPEAALIRAGAGLAALHRTGLHLGASWTPESELEAAGEVARLVERFHPEGAEALGSTVAALGASRGRAHFGPVVPCHGSFRLNHVLWDGAEARLLDLDSAVNASPWLDVANLWTHLHSLTCQGMLAVERAQQLWTAFRSGYEGQSPWAWNPNALDWFCASLLVRKQAYKCVKHLHVDAGARLPVILHEAMSRCAALPV